MGFRAVRFSLVVGREAASNRGSAVAGAVASRYFNGSLGADAGGGAGLIATVPLRDVHLVSFKNSNTDAATPLRTAAVEQEARWWQELAAAQAYQANGTLVALSDTTARASGVLEPVPHIRLAGAALAAYATTPTQISGLLYYTATDAADRVSGHEFTEFVDDAIDVPPVRSAIVTTLWNQIRLSSQALLGYVNQVPVIVSGCAIAKVSADRYIWTKPGDVGTAINQIPTTLAANDASHYRFFPSYFGVRVAETQAIKPLGAVPSQAVTVASGSLPILQVNRAPTHSRWLIGHDGNTHDVIVAHPLGSDLRTPLQIWAAVWAPVVLGKQPIDVYSVSIAGSQTFSVNGRLDGCYLDFARFIEPLDATTATIYSAVTQT